MAGRRDRLGNEALFRDHLKAAIPVSIRRLTPADAPEYRALRLRAFKDHPEAFTSSYEEAVLKPVASSEKRLASDSPGIFWGAFEAGVMAGMVGLDHEQRLKNRHKAVVIGMYVAPEFAGKGLGQQLLTALLDHARASQLELLVLTVTQGNDSAERLYVKAGFQSFGIEPRAIKVHNQYFAKNHMFLHLKEAP
jgi:ribosomal protein S18 acetylase RimI-like enzyme